MIKKLVSIALCIVLAIVVLQNVQAGSVTVRPDEQINLEKTAYIARGPIYINGPLNFTVGNGVTGGSGNDTDPYIISGWEIDASVHWGIWITNASAVFNIKNCHIYNGMNNSYEGIYLINSMNSSIQNCWIHHCYVGVYMWSCTKMHVFNNDLGFNSNEGTRNQYGNNNNINQNWIHNNSNGVLIL
jgi:parallel beta-helix repeat protein